ncbi:Gfo/Idh/MocA family oxidoreductase [Alkalihalobacillus hwajinpoensis]|uniref:Gfo/Idh/MocA family protein n=1 Tax=Guptibacillus hwajinpoensis TaxID=208199 RepID=UPI0018837542|nr:Gfo/Idh/MocA family oxidoreductase [Pseudalkalibacillus hwajinpoensis]MBF0707534.1 Gfo/Idh/MocA family oxidoreductase [Pseudalkalibacillus hwajinpoensis]
MVRFGVVGTNKITDNFLAGANELSEFKLTAVYSRTEEKAQAFAEKHGAEATFTSLEEMANSDVIDAVYIASPNSLHAEQSVIFMNAGKHVLCEKPMASNKREVTQMVEAASRNGVLLMEAMKSTVMPNMQMVRENLHKIGQVRRFVANYGQYSSRYDAYKEGTVLNAFNPKFSNGSLMDIGVYGVYPVVSMLGMPQSIKAEGVMLESGVDGEGSILLRYEDKEAVIMYSKITDSHLPSEIQGENGSILIDKIGSPLDVKIHYRDGSIEDLSQTQSHTMMYEAKEFIELIQSGQLESSINSHENSLRSVEVMDEARKQIGVVFPADQR